MILLSFHVIIINQSINWSIHLHLSLSSIHPYICIHPLPIHLSPSIHLSVYQSHQPIYLPFHPCISIHIYTTHSYIHMYLSAHTYIHSLIYQSTYPSTHPPIRLYQHTCLPIHPSALSLIHPPTHSSIHPSIYPSTHPSITHLLPGPSFCTDPSYMMIS